MFMSFGRSIMIEAKHDFIGDFDQVPQSYIYNIYMISTNQKFVNTS